MSLVIAALPVPSSTPDFFGQRLTTWEIHGGRHQHQHFSVFPCKTQMESDRCCVLLLSGLMASHGISLHLMASHGARNGEGLLGRLLEERADPQQDYPWAAICERHSNWCEIQNSQPLCGPNCSPLHLDIFFVWIFAGRI